MSVTLNSEEGLEMKGEIRTLRESRMDRVRIETETNLVQKIGITGRTKGEIGHMKKKTKKNVPG